MSKTSTRRTDAAMEGEDLAAFLLGVWTPCRSSHLVAARFLEEGQLLEVEFGGKGGSTFGQYPGFSADEAESFARAPSKMGWVHDHLISRGRQWVKLF